MYWDGINPIRMASIDFDMFWKFYVAGFTRAAVLKFTGKKLRSKIYAGHIVMNQDAGNEYLKEAISSGRPFMFGRYGSNELRIAYHAEMLKKDITNSIDCDSLRGSCEHSGFFPEEQEYMYRFNELMKDAAAQCDLYGTFRMILEDYYIKHFMKRNVKLTHLNMMDFWRYEVPFTSALKGKKVLVVHPLANQIAHQYEKREKLFSNPNILPEFELSTIQAVQTIAGERDPRFKDWFEALDYMTSEVKKVNFDIALLGCGAYGMPLAARIKQMGKQVIYMGGVLQMLFGIRGKRWDDEPKAAALYNEAWESPDPNQRPKNASTVEGGCYW